LNGQEANRSVRQRDGSLFSQPEKPGEFDCVSVELITRTRCSRREKVELRLLERERALLVGRANECVLEKTDKRIRSLDASRVVLLGGIETLVPVYPMAHERAVENNDFIEAVGTVRFNRRRDGCFTFGMSLGDVIAVWVDKAAGSVVRSEAIDW
jgi:hypothetical protein